MGQSQAGKGPIIMKTGLVEPRQPGVKVEAEVRVPRSFKCHLTPDLFHFERLWLGGLKGVNLLNHHEPFWSGNGGQGVSVL